MGPSRRRSTRKSSTTRRTTLFKNHSKSQEKSVVSPANSPSKIASSTTKVDSSKQGVENVGTSCSILDCSTPKAEKFRIPEINTCPPAPKKRRTLTTRSSIRRKPVAFYASPDIDLFFYFALRGIPV